MTQRGQAGPSERPSDRRETKYYGVAACLSLWHRRPRDIIRLYLQESRIPEFSAVLKWAAAQRRAYHLVSPEELERLTESVHHQGICILAREARPFPFADLLTLLRASPDAHLLVYLDRVENPHNLGAILRSAAHFGVRFILTDTTPTSRLSPAACRVAEGGAEKVALCPLARPVAQLRELAALGFQAVASVPSHGTPLYAHRFPPHTVLILGAESEGISRAVRHTADHAVHIPGSGEMESLNVSVAFGIVAGEFYRQQVFRSGAPGSSPPRPSGRPVSGIGREARPPRHRARPQRTALRKNRT